MTQSFNIRERFILGVANREEQNAAFDIIEATESDLLAKGLDIGVASVSYTHLTLPTILLV